MIDNGLTLVFSTASKFPLASLRVISKTLLVMFSEFIGLQKHCHLVFRPIDYLRNKALHRMKANQQDCD